jgi:tetratricopeptide (TPR) repeat protein
VGAARGAGDDAPPDADECAVRHIIELDRLDRQSAALSLAARVRSENSPDALAHAAGSLAPQDAVRFAALLAAAPDGSPATVADLEDAAHLAAARDRAAAGHGTIDGHRTANGHGAVAIAHLRELAGRRPDDPNVAFALGMRLGAAQQPAAALAIAERLPGGATGEPGRRLLGWFHVGAGEPRRAASFLLPAGVARATENAVRDALAEARRAGPERTAAQARKTLRGAPGDALGRLLLGLVAAHAGDDAEACAHLTAALARDPSLAVAANDLAWCLATRGDHGAAALSLASWAHHLAPDSPHVRNTHSEVRSRTRRTSASSERTSR